MSARSESALRELAALLSRVIDERIDARIGTHGADSARYSQRDGERPAGCGASKYLRIHKLVRDAGDPSATVQGRARLMTEECWTRWCNALPSRARKVMPPPAVSTISVDEVIASKLGIRRIA